MGTRIKSITTGKPRQRKLYGSSAIDFVFMGEINKALEFLI